MNEALVEEQAGKNFVLSIIIVNYNVKEEILFCIQSIRDKIDPARTPYEIIVSDNGSTDASVEAIREKFPWVKLIENNANLGFGKANNVAAAQAKGEVLFFLNPDTLIIKGIEEMTEYTKNNNEAGVLNPIIIQDGEELSYSPFFEFSFTGHILGFILRSYYTYLGKLQPKKIRGRTPFKVSQVFGSAMMIRKEVFRKISGFDEDLFMYGEEIDLVLKLDKLHCKNVVFPDSAIIHRGGAATDKKNYRKICYRGMKSEMLLLKKHFSYTWFLRYLLKIAVSLCAGVLAGMKLFILYFLSKKNYRDYKKIAANKLTKIKISMDVLINKEIC